MKAFIARRAAKKDLKDQLHAIWYFLLGLLSSKCLMGLRYCLPLDSDRALSETEMNFFETGTGAGKQIAISSIARWALTLVYASSGHCNFYQV